jgi:hypothetical protein
MFKYNSTQNWGTDFVTTLAAGTAFLNLNDQPADEVTLIIPSSGASIDVLCAGQAAEPTKFVTIDAPSGFVIPLSANTAEVMVRRTDLSGAATTVRYTWRKFRR